MNGLRPWLASGGILALATVAGYVAKALVLRRLRVLFERTETKVDDLLLDAVDRHLPLWFVLAGASAAAQAAPLSPERQLLAHKLVVSGFFVSLTLALSKFLSGAVRLTSAQFTASAAATNLAENLVRITVLAMGGLLLLSNLGVSIAPVLTALGVGSLAVALALQDTLANFFAGIHVVASRMVEVGDYVKLDSGQEGHVVDVGWRTTVLRELPDNLILLPNAKLSQAILVNYSRPSPELAVLVPVGLSYAADLERAEAVVLEVAREVQKTVAGAVSRFEPLLRYGGFGDSAVNATVVLRARSFADRPLLVHEFLKRLHRRCQREGLEIPFPQRVVHLRQP